MWGRPAAMCGRRVARGGPARSEMLMAPPRGVLRLMWRLHKWVWRVSGGRMGSRTVGMPVLELITTGHRSGQPRSVLLTYLEHGDGYVVIASNAGHAVDPKWWRNLEAKPEAEVRLAGRRVEVVARRTEGDERQELWRRAVAANGDYADYATATTRPIPVIALEPAR